MPQTGARHLFLEVSLSDILKTNFYKLRQVADSSLDQLIKLSVGVIIVQIHVAIPLCFVAFALQPTAILITLTMSSKRDEMRINGSWKKNGVIFVVRSSVRS